MQRASKQLSRQSPLGIRSQFSIPLGWQRIVRIKRILQPQHAQLRQIRDGSV
jgi:hypothetical protein